MTTINKSCSTCGEAKPLEKYHKDARGVLGVRAECKSCRSAKTKKPRELYLPNVTANPIQCSTCDATFVPTSNRQKYCTDCQKVKQKENCKQYYSKTYVKKGYDHLVLRNANNYKTGIGIYQKLKRLTMEELKCERCESKKYLLVHHKDRDRHNNEIENLELLCKSCHQLEHLIRDNKGRFKGSK